MIELFTIGFTNKSAAEFFKLLETNGVTKIIDTRLNNVSQLSGFAKARDLAFFAKRISQIDYEHRADLAPTKDLLESYRKKQITWDDYEIRYLNLLKSRRVEQTLDAQILAKSCLLCSEHSPEKCHRRLLAEYLKTHFPPISIVHLQ